MDLLRRCLAGDGEAWREWVAEVAPVVHRAVVQTLLRHTGRVSEDDAGDASQEVFLRLVKDDCRLLRSFDPARAGLNTWLTLVARSTAIDLLRRRRLPLTPLDERALERPAPCAPAATDLDIPKGLLSPQQELVLRLLLERDMEVADVARLLGVTPQTVRSAKHKALIALRGHFGVRRGKSGGSEG